MSAADSVSCWCQNVAFVSRLWMSREEKWCRSCHVKSPEATSSFSCSSLLPAPPAVSDYQRHTDEGCHETPLADHRVHAEKEEGCTNCNGKLWERALSPLGRVWLQLKFKHETCGNSQVLRRCRFLLRQVSSGLWRPRLNPWCISAHTRQRRRTAPWAKTTSCPSD